LENYSKGEEPATFASAPKITDTSEIPNDLVETEDSSNVR